MGSFPISLLLLLILNTISVRTMTYPWHNNTVTTMFWVGEPADDSNAGISNSPSAWDGSWKSHFGGLDDPDNRNGFWPKAFKPKENPFYFALPYNDLDENGERKESASWIVPWANTTDEPETNSICKNRWIEIQFKSKTCYAQWQDCGPLGEDDSDYVFGTAMPKSTFNDHAGLDVSPAVKTFLGLLLPDNFDRTNWRFVDFQDVPTGPWKDIITTRNTYAGQDSTSLSSASSCISSLFSLLFFWKMFC
eukprot:TRINITY_DN4700_c0_g1_i1.p1 TRINITY_DN4700_c0_g1~~TRINITY_DN4700_c0_g1_i1.p1  ORF type:complete len:249 (+),score=50.48 TRINITY_DN4700_c0_g1_i1:101-847(+)